MTTLIPEFLPTKEDPNPWIGAYYLFCTKCGGYVAWTLVFFDQSETVLHLEDGKDVLMTWAERLNATLVEWRSRPGTTCEFVSRGNEPGPCDCNTFKL